MDRVTRIGWAMMMVAGMCVGCGTGSAPEQASTPSQPSGIAAVADAANSPMAVAASDFMDAVIQGDTDRAESRLTPLAIQRIKESDKEFRPPGLDNATFRVGEVRTPSENQAIVQYVLTYTSSAGTQKSEELCCLLRQVDGQWRVSGIASSSEPGRPPIILDFENPPPTPPLPPRMAAAPGQSAADIPAASRPSPPRAPQDASASYR